MFVWAIVVWTGIAFCEATGFVESQGSLVGFCDLQENFPAICLCRIGHVACYESFQHALQDLIANGRVKCFGDTLVAA